MIDWPTAATILGALATLCVGIIQYGQMQRPAEAEPTNGRIYAKATDFVEIKTRLVALERAHEVTRDEICRDIKDLEALIRNK
jgi:hypothetical protein